MVSQVLYVPRIFGRDGQPPPGQLCSGGDGYSDIHGVGVFLFLVLIFETLIALLIQQAALDLDTVCGISVTLKIESIRINATTLPRLVLYGVGDPYAQGSVTRGS